MRSASLIEFRQAYIGPRRWRYETLLRAGDCPADAVRNRMATVDIRVLAGDRAGHADMLMWDPAATAEGCAADRDPVLGPQVSVRLDLISDLHRRVLAFGLGVADRSRSILRHGALATAGAAQRFAHARAPRRWSSTAAPARSYRRRAWSSATGRGGPRCRPTDSPS